MNNAHSSHPVRSLSRYLILAAGLSLGSALALAQGESSSVGDAPSPYQVAVNNYVTGAGKELDAFKAQIAAGEKADPTAGKFADAKAALSQSEHQLDALRSADQSTFDPRKADFERSLGKLAESMKAAQK